MPSADPVSHAPMCRATKHGHAGGDRGEEGGYEHDRLVRQAHRGDHARAEVASHEGVGQPHQHVQHLLADGRQSQIQHAVGSLVGQAGL